MQILFVQLQKSFVTKVLKTESAFLGLLKLKLKKMKKRIFRYLKHIVVTFLILGVLAISFGLYHGASFRYAENPEMMNWDKDGPYIFDKNDSVVTENYVRGNQDDGFYLHQKDYPLDSKISTYCYFPLDSTRFEFTINNKIEIPKNTYNDNSKILAISDIESGFKTFRDFLITNKVVDNKLNWTFGNGHLVLLGDFVDRDFLLRKFFGLFTNWSKKQKKKVEMFITFWETTN